MQPGLYAILDLPHPSSLGPSQIAALLLERAAGEPPLAALQLRDKHASTPARIAALRGLAPRCAAAGVPLIVNDDLAAAREGPPGVGLHLGHEDLRALVARAERPPRDALLELREALGADALLGLSTHTHAQVLAAQALPLDYIGFGPVFATRSKTNPDPEVGLAGLARACLESQLPVIAIGGLDAARGAAAREAGAHAVAMISALAGRDECEIRRRVRRARDAVA